MADEARSIRDFGVDRLLAGATVTAYEVQQTPTGKAGVNDSATPYSSGDYFQLTTIGQFTIAKATGFVALKGGRAYWDYSANNITYKKVNDRDFYVGRFAEDASSTATTCVVDLNADPPYDLDLARDAFLSVLVGTPAAGGFGYPVRLGGAMIFELTATSEAQKVDALGVDGFSKDSNAIIEGAFRVISDGGSGSQDISIGIADGTHASDFETVATFVALHLDGNTTTINAESDDGSTDVAPTDTLTTYTEGSDYAKRVEFWMDLRDPNDVQIYINGSLVLAATVFTLAASSSTLFLIVHVEKASGTDTYKLAVDWLRARFTEF